MSFIRRTQQEIAQEITNKLTESGQQPDADASAGTVQRDVIDLWADAISKAYDRLEETRKLISLQNAPLVTTDALSPIALNFDVVRIEATKATGKVTFQRRSVPTADITIPAGTVVQTPADADGTVIKYTTDAAVTLAATTAKNQLTGYYEVDANVTADKTGTGQHVGTAALSELPTRISGINRVTNKSPINNAADQETNDILAGRIRTKTGGSTYGTPDGYKSSILAQFSASISAVEVVGPREADNRRAQYGNEVDVPLIVSSNAASFTTELTASGATETRFVETRPIKTVVTVVGTTNGTLYQSGVDYGVRIDTSPIWGYSARSLDALTWFPGKVPPAGLRLTVQGTYVDAVKKVQDFVDDRTRRYVTGDLLAKEAQRILVDISLTVSAKSGVDRTALATDIANAIVAALDKYALGQDVLEDDIIVIAQGVTGVDFVEVPIATLKKSTDSAGVGTVVIRAQEFPRAGTITVTVN